MPLFIDRLPFHVWVDPTRTPALTYWTVVLPVLVTEPTLLAPPPVTNVQEWVVDTGNRGEAFAWRLASRYASRHETGIVVPNSSGTGRSIDELLMPGGNPIGVKGTGPRASARLREVPGGQPEAERLFQELTQGGQDITPANYPGTLIELPNGRGAVGYRPASKSGPPTIDVNVVDAAGQPIPIEKIKFID